MLRRRLTAVRTCFSALLLGTRTRLRLWSVGMNMIFCYVEIFVEGS